MITFLDENDVEYGALATIKATNAVNGERSITGEIISGDAVLSRIERGWRLRFEDEYYVVTYAKPVDEGKNVQVSFDAVHQFFWDFGKSSVYDQLSDGSHTFRAYLDFIFDKSGYRYDIESSLTVKAFEKQSFGYKNRLSLFNDVITSSGVEFQVNGKVVRILAKVGTDLSTVVRKNFNLNELGIEKNIGNFVTYQKGFGAYFDEEDHSKGRLIAEYTSPLASVYGKLEADPLVDERYKQSESLLNALKNTVDNSYTISVSLDMEDLTRAGYRYTQPVAGDYIMAINETLGFKEKIRIVSFTSEYDVQGILVKHTVTCNDIGSVKKLSASYTQTQHQAANAEVNANTAYEFANKALVSANGKNTNYYGDTFPVDNPKGTLKKGDLLFLTVGDTVKQYYWNGAEWVTNPVVSDVEAFKEQIAEELKDVPNREEFENKISEEIANSKAEIGTQIETAKTQAESNAKEYADTINQETANVAEQANAAADEIKADLVNVKNNLTATSLVANNAQAAVDEAKQDLANVNTKVDNAKAELTQAKQDLINVASELNTAKQDLADSVTAVNTKVDSAKAELTQAKQDLINVASELNTAKQDLADSVTAVNTKVDSAKAELTQAKQDLVSQAQQLQTQANAQTELTKRVTTVETTANGTKTTVNELTKTVSQNGKDITSVTNRTKTVEDDLAGTKTTLSQVKTTADSTSQKTATLETGLNGLSAKFENLQIGTKNILRNTSTIQLDSKTENYAKGTWEITSGGNGTAQVFDIDDAPRAEITNAVRIINNTSGGNKVICQRYVPVDFGEQYTVSCWARVSAQSDTDSVTLLMRCWTTSAVNKELKTAISNTEWKRYTLTFTTESTDNHSLQFGQSGGGVIEICGMQLEKGNIVSDYSKNDWDLSQKVAEYKQNADQNYASLQTTVQNLDGTVQHNKTVADQTAQGFTTRIESLETYKDGETTRANQYFELAKTETARQLTAERTAIAKDYVAKSTYTSDVTGIRNELTATTTTANTTKTNLANYQASNDRAVANLQSNLQTANGNISSLKTKVEAVPGQITSAVSSVESKIPKTVGGRNLALGTSADWSAGRTSFNGQDNQSGTIYRVYNRGFKIGDKVNVRLVLKYSDIAATEGQSARGVIQFRGNVTDWASGQLDGGGWFRFDKSDGEIELKATTVVSESILKNEYWEWRLRVDYVKRGKIQWKEAKAEVGDLPTPWSPAPEDTAEQISNLSSEIKQTADGMTLLATKTELSTAKNELQSGINTATNKANAAQSAANNNAQVISTHTTQISALNTGLQAKVSQSDFNTLSGRVTTAENNITAKANELSSKITSVEGKIPTEIGSSNLLRKTAINTENLKLFGKTDTTVNVVEKDGHQVYKLTVSGSNNAGAYFKDNENYYNLVKDRNYTFSFWVLTNKDKSYSSASLGHIQAVNNNSDKVGNDPLHQHTQPVYSTNVIKANTWTKAWCTFKATSNSFFIPYFWYLKAGDEIYIYDMMLNEGKVPLSYTPAPEDTESDITKLSSELTQTKDGITLLATKTELNNAKSELQSGINTATNKANAAQSAANNNAQVISTHTTQISALNTGLQAKVSQTDFNTLSGRVSTAENNITAKANELSSKITSVESKIPTSVGGTNYLTNVSSNWQNKYVVVNDSIVDSFLQQDSSTRISPKSFIAVEGGKQYTISLKELSDVDYYFKVTMSTVAAYGVANSRLNGDEWIRTETCTFTAPVNCKYVMISVGCDSGVTPEDLNTKFNIKLERGNIATDYSPAPEDTAEQISSLSSQIKQTADGITLLATKTELNTAKSDLQSGINTATNKANAAQNTANNAQNKANNNAQTISTHTTQISALNTGLQAKVSQTDFNTLSGRVTTAENNITAKANELSSKITSVEGKIPTEIGSSNLLRKTAVNTENLKLFGKTDTTISVVGKDGHQVYKLVVSGSSNAGAYFSGNDNYYNLVKDRNYTFSFWVLANKDKNFNMSSLGHIQAVNNNSDKVGNDALHQHTSPVYSTSVVKANTWTKVWCTFKATSNSFFRPYFWYLKAGDEIYIYDMMLNEGKVPLSYTPAPEDTISQISSLSSELKQTKDGITLLATKTELNSAKTELQSGISTATNKANAAQNTANSAQNKANNNAQTISTHTTQISALNTGLQAKVSQTDFNTLSGRVTSAENNITAKANELTSKITSVEGKIPTEIGAVNLFKGSRDFSGSWWNAGGSVYAEDYKGVKIFKRQNVWGGVSQFFEVKTGEEYVFSAYVKSSAKTDRVTFYLNHKDKHPPAGGTVSFDSNSGRDFVDLDLTDKYKRIAVKIKITSSGWIAPRLERSNTNAYLFFGGYKLERGNVATDWSPAPEDYDSKLASAQSEFKQTTDSIKASVSSLDKSTVKSSSLTINADGIVMKAGKSTTDVANAIGSYFAVNQNAINLFSDKINVKGNMIVSGAITSDKIASKQINTAHLNGKIITADVISSNAVTANAIKAGAVTTDKMSANSINGDRIAAGTLDAAKIKAGSISASQIASGTLTSAQIKAGSIKSINIEASAITSDKIASNSIDASKIVTNGLTANIIKGGVLQSVNGSTNFELNTGKLFYNNNNTGVFRVQNGASTMGLKFSNTSISVGGTNRILSRAILGGDRRETTLDDGKWDKGGFSGLVIETIKGVEPATNEHADALRAISDTIYFTHTYSADSPTGVSAHGWKMETYAPNSSYSGNIVLKPYGINCRQSDIIVGDVRLDNGDGSGYWVRATINTLKACFGHILNGGISSQALNAIRSELNKISGT